MPSPEQDYFAGFAMRHPVVDTTHKITKIDLPNLAQIKLF